MSLKMKLVIIISVLILQVSEGWDHGGVTKFVTTYCNKLEVKNTLIFRLSHDQEWNNLAENIFYDLSRHTTSLTSISPAIDAKGIILRKCSYSVALAINFSKQNRNKYANKVNKCLASTLFKTLLPRTLIIAPLISLHQAAVLKSVLDPAATVKYQWLILSDHRLSERLQDFYLPLVNKVTVANMNKDEVTLWELYQFSPTYDQKVVRVGRWVPPSSHQLEGLLETPGTDVVPRRSDLTGFHIRCSYKQLFPFNVLKKRDDHEIYTGTVDPLWMDLQQKLNFSFACHEPDDGEYGSLENGSWTGVIGDLVRGKADATFTSLSKTSRRARAVDFSIASSRESWVIVLQKTQNLDSSWKSYVQEFSWDSWLMITVMVMVTSVTLFLTVRLSPLEKTTVTISESFSLVLGSIACQGWWVDLRTTSTRLILAATMVTASLLYYHYNATLTSALAASSFSLPFNDLQGFYESRGDYKLLTLRSSAYRYRFQVSTDPLLQKIWRDMIAPFPENMVDSIAEGNKEVRRGNTGFISTLSTFEYTFGNDCQYTYIPIRHFFVWKAMAFRKDSYIKDLIDEALLRIMSGGLQDRHEKHQQFRLFCEPAQIQAFGMNKVIVAFALLATGLCLSCFILLVESRFHT